MLEVAFDLFVLGLLGVVVGTGLAGLLFFDAGVSDPLLLTSLAIGFGAPTGYLLEALLFTAAERLARPSKRFRIAIPARWFLSSLLALGIFATLYSALAMVATASLAMATTDPSRNAPWMKAWLVVFGFRDEREPFIVGRSAA